MGEGKKRNKNGSIFSECFDRVYWEVEESGEKKKEKRKTKKNWIWKRNIGWREETRKWWTDVLQYMINRKGKWRIEERKKVEKEEEKKKWKLRVTGYTDIGLSSRLALSTHPYSILILRTVP